MNHEEVLNTILANTCPNDTDGKLRWFTIEGHCIRFNIKAKLIYAIPGKSKYEIIEFDSTPV